jgi:hypothetical protein
LVAVDWAELPASESPQDRESLEPVDPGALDLSTDTAQAAAEPEPEREPAQEGTLEATEDVVADSIAGTAAEEAPVTGPRAEAEDFVLTGDSLDVEAPGGSLERVVSAGRARGESTSRDSLNSAATPPALRTDWIEGDTIVAEFAPVFARADSVPSDEDGLTLRRLTASGSAKSLYRLEPERAPVDSVAADSAAAESDSVTVTVDSLAVAPDSVTAPADSLAVSPAAASTPEDVKEPLPLHFVAGDRIIITMRQGEIEKMEVEGQTRGLYLQPNIDRRRGASLSGTGQGESG